MAKHLGQRFHAVMSKKATYRCCVFFAVAMVTLACAVVVLTTIAIGTMNKKHTDNVKASGRTQRHIDKLDNNDDIDLRINTEDSSCMEPSCVTCNTEVEPNFEPFACGTAPEIKNGSCFLCKEKCLTFNDLVAKANQRLRCPYSVKIECCILSTMGNLIHYCGPEGHYNCYRHKVHKRLRQSVHKPICKCPAGSQDTHCQNPYTETARCRCFESRRLFCGQEHMTQCDQIKKRWTQCQMSTETYNCLCSPEVETDDQLTDCTDPDIDVWNS